MTTATQTQQIHKYFFLNRPPGSQPPGHTQIEAWIPKQFPAEFPRGAWGFAIYPNPLPLIDIWAKDLFPADPLEKTVYLAWQDCDRKPDQTLIFLMEYWFLPEDELTGLAVVEDDFTAQDVLEARKAGYTFPQAEALLGVEAEAGWYQRLGIEEEA